MLFLVKLLNICLFFFRDTQSTTAGTGPTKAGAQTACNRDKIECWQPWKRRTRPYNAEKLLIPLPVPHPAHIAVTIHNRDTDDVIPLDSELCRDILR